MKKFLALSLSLLLVVVSISAFGVVVSANPNDINDDLTDFSKIYQSSGSETLVTYNLDPAWAPAGDSTGLLKVDNNAERYVTYQVSGSVNVTVEYVNYGGDTNYAKNKMYVYQSSDNVTYTEVVCASNPIASNGDWHRMNVVSNATASNTQYIKVLYDNTYPANWTPIMTSVVIQHVALPPFTGITDDLTDLSKTIATSGTGTLNSWTGDTVNFPAGDITGYIKANHDAERFVTYKVSGSVVVTAEYFMNSGDVEFSKNKVGVFYSVDNVTFTEASCASNNINSSSAGWDRMNVVSSALPANVEYIKIVLDRSAQVWDSILLNVSIEVATIPPFADINDDLTDLSKTFATSGAATLSTWTGDLVNFPAGDITGYIKANHDAERFITYKVSGVVQVTAEYLINSGDEIFALNKMKLYYSVDNVTYKAITCKSNLINQHVNGWKRMNIVSNPLPADAQYVKLVYDRSAQVWDSILVDVDIVSSTLLPIAFYSYDMSVSNIITKVAESTTSTAFAADAYKTEGVTLTLKRNGTTLGASDLVGTGVVAEVFTGSETVNYTIFLKGDVDGNGTIALADLAAMKLHLLQSTQLTGIYKSAGSLHNGTNVTIIDLILVKHHLIGLYTISQA